MTGPSSGPTTGERWERLAELFHAARALDPSERARFLDAACAGDAAMRADVERLLAADERAGGRGFIEAPAVASLGTSLGRSLGAALGRSLGGALGGASGAGDEA